MVLTFAIWLVGGGKSPFLAFYLLHAILASVLLSRRAAYGHAAVGYLFLAGLVLGEWSGVIPRHRPLGAVSVGGEDDFSVVLTVLFVYSLLTAVTTVLTTGIVRLLRLNEQGLLEASERLEGLADMRRSFLHVVLHDLRSPVGTVVTMLEGLSGGVDGELGQAAKKRVDRAGEKLRGVLDLLRSLRVLANLETERLESLMAPVDVRATIRAAVEDQTDAAEQGGNACKWCCPSPCQRFAASNGSCVRPWRTTSPTPSSTRIRMAPSWCARCRSVRLYASRSATAGLGSLPRIKLACSRSCRVAKRGAPPAKTSGIGLGLSIVRRIAEAHDGRAGVESQAGQGSTFFLELPSSR